MSANNYLKVNLTKLEIQHCDMDTELGGQIYKCKTLKELIKKVKELQDNDELLEYGTWFIGELK